MIFSAVRESAMVPPFEFARAVVPHGTTSVIIDPHEIANVLGVDGIRYMLEASKYTPFSVYVMVPSCVPATNLETNGGVLRWSDLITFKDDPWVVGLGEMMNYPGVLYRDEAVLDKLRAFADRRIDGHAPGVTGRDLESYVAAGIGSDHECTTVEEAREEAFGARLRANLGRPSADLLPPPVKHLSRGTGVQVPEWTTHPTLDTRPTDDTLGEPARWVRPRDNISRSLSRRRGGTGSGLKSPNSPYQPSGTSPCSDISRMPGCGSPQSERCADVHLSIRNVGQQFDTDLYPRMVFA